MKSKIRSLKPVMILMVLATVFLAGCQAVGGVDFNSVLKQSLKVTSGESNTAVSLDLTLSEDAADYYTEEELEVFEMFAHTKLEITNAKAQDENNASFDGAFSFGQDYGTRIGFSLALSDTTMVLELDGAKHPFVMDLSAQSALYEDYEDGTEAEESISEETLTELGAKITDAVGEYVIDNMPNPDSLNVSSVTAPINGQETSLYLAQAEMNGPEVWNWLKGYVDALAGDKEGLTQMVTAVFEAISSEPALMESFGMEDGVTPLDAPTEEESLKESIDAFVFVLEMLRDEMAAAEQAEDSSLGELFNEDTYIKADIYVDKKMDIRKQDIEVAIHPQGDLLEYTFFPLSSIVLNVSSESWNVNGEVESVEAVVPEGAVSLDELMMGQGYEWLQQFEESSPIYDILKNKMHVGLQEVYLFTDDYLPPIITPTNVTIVPLRYTAEELGAEVEYNNETKKYEVFDKATGKTIVLQNGSDTVSVNGASVKWQFPVTLVDGTLYVPARDFVQTVGATLAWESFYEDGTNDLLIISREL